MPLTLHHLHLSQSERIVWLLEELALPYTLVQHTRRPDNGLAPDSLKNIIFAGTPLPGTAPVLIDDGPTPPVILAESAAIVDYIIYVHGNGQLAVKPGEKGYADYLNWFHFANATLQVAISRMMVLTRLLPPSEDKNAPQNPYATFLHTKLSTILNLVNDRVKLANAYLAGDDLTAADIMSVFTLTTMRGFYPVDLGPYPAILEYLKRVSERDGYKSALQKGEEDLKPMIGAKVERFMFGPRKK